MTNRELLHEKLKEINLLVDLTIACDAYLDTEEKVNIVLNAINNGELKTNDDVCFKFLEIDCGHDVRKKMTDNFKAVCRILSSLEKQMDKPYADSIEFDYEQLGISKERWIKYIEMMQDIETQSCKESIKQLKELRKLLAKNEILSKLSKLSKSYVLIC